MTGEDVAGIAGRLTVAQLSALRWLAMGNVGGWHAFYGRGNEQPRVQTYRALQRNGLVDVQTTNVDVTITINDKGRAHLERQSHVG